MVRGCFVSEAVGEMSYFPHNDSQNYGDAVEGAKTAAFRRCCKEFGIGLQAWKKDWCAGWWQRKNKKLIPQAPSANAGQASHVATNQPLTPSTPAAKSTMPPGQTLLPVCQISLVTAKSGTDAKGKPWNAWFVKFSDGVAEVEAVTFSHTVGEVAEQLSQTGETARVVIEPGKKPGRMNIVSIERAETPPTTEEDNVRMDYPETEPIGTTP